MQQRYQTQFDSFDGLVTVVQAIEGFSQERFLASLHLRNTRTLSDIAAIDAKVLAAIASLQAQHAQLLDFSRNFNRQFVTRNNRYFNSAHQLLRKIHSGVTQMKHIYKQFTPNSSVTIPQSAQPIYTQPSIYDRSPLAKESYTKPMFGVDTYPVEVQQLCEDMTRFFKVLRDSLLVCLEVMRQEEYIRRDANLCHELYRDFKEENYLRIKRHINSINIFSNEFSPLQNHAIDLRLSSNSEQEFSQKGFHSLEYEDVCSLAVKELVEEEQRGEFTKEELMLWKEDRSKIQQIRYIISHFDDYIPATYRRKTMPATYVACLMAWCEPQEDLAFVNYFAQTYKATHNRYNPPSNPAVNQAKRTDWTRDPEFEHLISQWKNVDLN